jgi:hypothetical protein
MVEAASACLQEAQHGNSLCVVAERAHCQYSQQWPHVHGSGMQQAVLQTQGLPVRMDVCSGWVVELCSFEYVASVSAGICVSTAGWYSE